MAPTVSHPAPRAHYRAVLPVAKETPEAYLSEKLGRTEAGIHQLLYAPMKSGLKLNELCALVVEAHVTTRSSDRLARWYAPIRQAFAAAGHVDLTASVFRTVCAADAEDDKSRTAYILEPNDANGQRLIDDIDRAVGRLLELRTGLVEKHHLERRS